MRCCLPVFGPAWLAVAALGPGSELPGTGLGLESGLEPSAPEQFGLVPAGARRSAASVSLAH